MEHMRRVVEGRARHIMRLPNVNGMGVGFKSTKGEDTGKLSIVILVERKLPPDALAPQHLVPEAIDGLETDVIEVGVLRTLLQLPNQGVRSLTHRIPGGWVHRPQQFPRTEDMSQTPFPLDARLARQRPAPPGVSIGHYKISAGTLGAIVYRRGDPRPMILSNNHVLANSTNGNDGRARLGDPILQPGPADGGTERDRIATLADFVPLRRNPAAHPTDDEDETPSNLMDVALAFPASPDLIEAAILDIGTVAGITAPQVKQQVRKSGRTTGLTTGTVNVIHTTVTVHYGPGETVSFSDQVMATAMSKPGDSGSLVLDMENRAIGLLFAGSPTATIFSPIEAVANRLGLTFGPPMAGSQWLRR